jgi:hypothetical protein
MYELAGSKSAKLVVQKIREIVTRSALVYCLPLTCEYINKSSHWFTVFYSGNPK